MSGLAIRIKLTRLTTDPNLLNMEKNSILITGSQRSGTTLLHLILDSHPEIASIDEDKFIETKLTDYLEDNKTPNNVSFKLPDYVHAFDRIRSWPNLKVLFCIRDPRDVVSSMTTLTLPMGPFEAPWVAHPLGGALQIYYCARLLAQLTKKDISEHLINYPIIAVKPARERSHDDNIYSAALCWRLINQLHPLYRRINTPVGVVPYEKLVESPKQILEEIMQFLGLPFHDDLLRHHELHEGESIGNTDNKRAIDSSSKGKWKDALSDNDLDVVRELCGPLAKEFGYEI